LGLGIEVEGASVANFRVVVIRELRKGGG